MPAIPAISAWRRDAALILLDCGTRAAEGAFALHAHAGFLAFELSSGPHRHRGQLRRGRQRPARLGCGAARHRGPFHLDPGRSLQRPDPAAGLGARPSGAAADRRARSSLSPGAAKPRRAGWWKPAMTPMSPQFGVRHERQITLSPQGLMVTGADRLVPVTARRGALGFRRALSHPSRCAGLAAGGRRHPAQAAERRGLALPRRRRRVDGRGKHLSGRRRRCAGPSSW